MGWTSGIKDTDTITFNGFYDTINDVIAVCAGHPLLEACIKSSIKNYDRLDQETGKLKELSRMDEKRSQSAAGLASQRSEFTIEASGPGLLSREADSQWNEFYDPIKDTLTIDDAVSMLFSTVFAGSKHPKIASPLHMQLTGDYAPDRATIKAENLGPPIRVAGLDAQPSSHQTWLRKQTTPSSFGLGEP